MQSVDQTLESHKVSNHLEDPENSHDPQKPDNLPSFANDVKVLKPSEDNGEEVGDQRHQVHLHNHFIDNLDFGDWGQVNFTKFIPSLINFLLFGDMRSLATYSTKKKLTATVSKACEKKSTIFCSAFARQPEAPRAAPISPPPSPR